MLRIVAITNPPMIANAKDIRKIAENAKMRIATVASTGRSRGSGYCRGCRRRGRRRCATELYSDPGVSAGLLPETEIAVQVVLDDGRGDADDLLSFRLRQAGELDAVAHQDDADDLSRNHRRAQVAVVFAH